MPFMHTVCSHVYDALRICIFKQGGWGAPSSCYYHMFTCRHLIWFTLAESPASPLSALTFEALAALADEAVELVDAGAGVLARAGQAVVAVQVAVLPHPAGLAVTPVSVRGNTQRVGLSEK